MIQKSLNIAFIASVLLILIPLMSISTATQTTIYATRYKLRQYNSADDATSSENTTSTTEQPCGMYVRPGTYSSEILCVFDISTIPNGSTIDYVDFGYNVSATTAGTDAVEIFVCDRTWTAPITYDDLGAAWTISIASETCNTTGWNGWDNNATLKSLVEDSLATSEEIQIALTNDPQFYGNEMGVTRVRLVIDYTTTNNSPTGGNDTKTILEDNTTATFQTSDFTYSDTDSDPFAGIKIKSLETVGDLEYSSVDVVDETAYATMTNLIFKPASDANGTSYASFTHQVYDGEDYSTITYTMTINITAVNDEPSFTKGSDQNVHENCGAQSISTWATNLDKGASNESSQTLTFTVTNDNNPLFSSQPAVSSTGTLTFTPTTDTYGEASCSIYLKDNGGTANSGDDQSPSLSFNITVNEIEDPANWNSSMRIYINTTVDGADIPDNVLDFPLLVRLDPSNFDFFSDVADDGADIRFLKPDNTTFLAYEIEHWVDGASDKDTAVVWVKVDTVYGNSGDQYIKMFWNKSGETTTSNSSNVFQDSKNFKAVWHLDSSKTGTGTVDVYHDATSNSNDGDDFVSATVKEGISKYGQEFDGSDDYIGISQSASLDITGDATISGWFKLDANFSSASATSQIVLEKYSNATNNMHISFVGSDYDYPWLSDGALVFKIENTDNFRFIQTDITNWVSDIWYHFAIQIDQDEPSSNKIFINGIDRTN